MEEDITYTFYFDQGRQSARIGRCLTANPYIDHIGIAWRAWTDGYRSVDLKQLAPADRALIYFEGWSAAQVKISLRDCPYLVNDGCEKVDLWMIGYTDAHGPVAKPNGESG